MNAGREKVERQGECRACGDQDTDHLDAAHLWPRSLGGTGFDNPDLIVPLCSVIKGGTGCHDDFDNHKLDLRAIVTMAEQVALVRAAGSIERARTRLMGKAGFEGPKVYGPF